MSRIPTSELRYSRVSRALLAAAGHARMLKPALRLALRLEGGQFYSGTARSILRQHCGVTIGSYSYGECFTPGRFQQNTVVGRYVSIGPGVRTFVRNHPTDTLSTHPFFFNRHLGLVDEDTVPFGDLSIGHDAWLGCNVIITPGCRRVGMGAVVAAGTVLTRDVPDFALVGGVPGRVLRFRFSEEARTEIVASRWWERSPAQLAAHLAALTRPLPDDPEARGRLLRDLAARDDTLL